MTQDMNHTITKVLKAMLVAMMMSLTGGNAIAQVKVKGNVFGGGNEADVQTNTEVNISAGSVEGNVYGGGNLGDVGRINRTLSGFNYKWTDDAVSTSDPADKTYDYNNTGSCKVQITGGTIGANGISTANHASGHVFGAGKGATSSFYCEKGMVYTTSVTISKGTVYGNVYGGGEVGRVESDAIVSIDGTNENDTEIKGGVFGAGAGVETHGYSALLRGDATVTVQGKAKVGMNVYGGGEIASVGRFKVENSLPTKPLSGGTCKVTIQGDAQVGTGSDGGSVYGACKGVEPGNYSSATHVISDGSSQGFTGANAEADYLAFLKTLALTSNTDVTIDGNASVNGSIYGGGRRGVTLGSVAVNMTGGTVTNDVYGGGALADTNTGNWHADYGEVAGLTTGDIVTGYYTRSGEGTPTNPYIYNEITAANTPFDAGTTYYSINTWAHVTKKSALYTTNVSLTGGVVGNAYGGALGSSTVAANVWGDVLVSVNGTAFTHTNETFANGDGSSIPKTGRVFGCNNLNGSPKGDVTVHVYQTVGLNSDGTINNTKPTKGTNTYELSAVYGGGNQAEYYPVRADATDATEANHVHTNVIIDGCTQTSIGTVYGGGNAASTPSTCVTVNGAYEIGEVFGGGNGKDKVDENTANPGAHVGFHKYTSDSDKASQKYGFGKAQVNIGAGVIHAVYGGSNAKGNVRDVAIATLDHLTTGCEFAVGKAYGGGKAAEMDGRAVLQLGCIPTIDEVYGGAESANIHNDVELTITNGTYKRIFGGNNKSGNIDGAITINIEETGCTPIVIGQIFAGGNEAAYTTPSGKADPVINVKSFTSIGQIFGGGFGPTAVLTGNPTIYIDEIVGDNAAAYTAETFNYDNDTEDTSDDYTVVVPAHTVNTIGTIGDVYGGGYGADVVGDVTVNIGTQEKIELETTPHRSGITADANGKYTVTGVDIARNVYGGGYGAATTVTGNVAVNVGGEKTESETTTFIGGTITIGESVYGGSALGAVNATRGTSGLSKTADATTAVTLKKGTISGAVYGGGMGDLATLGSGHSDVTAQVFGDAKVTLYGDVIAGGIYGGCNLNGTMLGKAQLDLLGGTVGAAFDATNVPTEIPNIVFGGGLGAKTSVVGDVTVNVNKSDKTPNGVAIYSNVYGGSKNGSVAVANVNLEGGVIWGDVFGGGYETASNATAATNATVTLNGTAFGITYVKDDNNNDVPMTGRIFGCNNLQGSPTGNVIVNVEKTVAGNVTRTAAGTNGKPQSGVTPTYELQAVYGGGNLAPYNPTVSGAKSQVNIRGCNDTSIEYVYGGGNAAAMGSTTNTVGSNLNVEGAYEIGFTFGGGNGSDRIKSSTSSTGWTENPGANVNGNATSTLVGGFIHNVFGGSNTLGTITGEAKIDIDENGNTCDLITENIYGAGMNADVEGDVNLRIGCLADNVKNVYGGAMAAKINGNVTLTITSGVLENVYGGNNESGSISGKITVNIEETDECKPIVIGNLYGGGNLAAYPGPYFTNNNPGIEVNVKSFTSIGNIYGGGRGSTAVVTGNTEVNINEVKGRWAGTARAAETLTINGVQVTIPEHKANEIGAIGNVYGGGDAAAVVGDATVNIGTETKTYFVTEPVNYRTAANTPLTPVASGDHKGLYEVTVEGAKITGNVYGGGNLADVGQYHEVYDETTKATTDVIDVTGNTYVNICAKDVSANDNPVWQSVAVGSSGVTIGGNVFGGGKGIADSFRCGKAMVTGGTNVHIGNGTTGGNVYGGGEVGRVEGNAVVMIGLTSEANQTSAPHIMGNVFGAGSGVMTHGYSALLRGKTEVTIQSDTKVDGSVYGGGEIASVGRFKVKTPNDTEAPSWLPMGMPYSLWDATTESGKCTVIVQGNAEIGPDNMKMTTVGGPDDAGHVFGAGKGVTPEVYAYTNKATMPKRMMAYDESRYKASYGANEEPIIWEYHSDTDHANVWEYFDTEAKYLTFVETMALVNKTDVTIGNNAEGATDNPFIKGSVYGGSENGQVKHDTHVTIKSGQIGCATGMKTRYGDVFIDPATTAVTTSLATCDTWTYVDNGYTYDKFADENGNYSYTGKYAVIPEAEQLKPTATSDGSRGGRPTATDGHTFYGNVFGGGSGYYPYAPGKWHSAAGMVGGDTQVDIEGGHILSNVYGGNEQTDVGSYTTDNNGAPHIEKGGTCTVNMKGGTIGVPRTKDDIAKKPVIGNLFGAGKGDKRVLFNTKTNVNQTFVNVTGGIVYGSVFGGGEDGHVLEDATTKIEQASGKTITIGSTGESTADGNVFGGGRGSETALTAGVVGGNVSLTINSGNILGSVYGGGRLASVGTNFVNPNNADLYGKLQEDDATKHGNITINIKDGTIGTANTTGVGGNIYGGSKGTTTNFNLGITRSTKINMTDGIVYASVYGGGELAQVVGSHTTDGKTLGTEINISGGTIGTSGKGTATWGNVFGGGKGNTTNVEAGLINTNTKVSISQADGKTTTIYHNIYGGGAYGSVGEFSYDATTGLPTGCKENTSGGKAEVIITGGTIGTTGKENGMVFGSSRGDVGAPGEIHDKLAWVYDANVIIGTSGATGPAIKGSVYGSGENGHTFNNAVVTVHSGTIGITDTTIDGGAAYAYRGNVYGGGCGTDKYYSDRTKEKNDGNGDTYNPLAGIVYGDAKVTVDGGQVVRNVYGAGAMGSVGKTVTTGGVSKTTGGQTTISISGGQVGVDGTAGDGNVFGAARGDADAISNEFALVRKETSVSINGNASVKGNVYGGGELGCVGVYTMSDDMRTFTWKDTDGTTNTADNSKNTGICNVTIDGSSVINGNVFGAGKGKDDTFWCEKGIAYSTNVSVANGNVKGNVYGGGEVGRVETDTKVMIGIAPGEGGSKSEPTINGSVFGGGAGVETHGYSALVRGNTTVTVDQYAHVGHSVYGGGEIASVGKYGLDENKMPSILQGGGYCYVTVKGNATIADDVFGAGEGVKSHFDNTNNDLSKRSRRMTLKNGWESLSGDARFDWDYLESESAYSTYLETLALATHPEVTIGESAAINGSVFGGGELGLTKGSVIVNIKGGTIAEDVYGGGSLANTNTTSTVEINGVTQTVHPTTKVNLLGGTIKGDAYGGGLGRKEYGTKGQAGYESPVEATVYGDVLVELNNHKKANGEMDEGAKGCVVNRVFGCNNLNGSPKGKVQVYVYATQRGGGENIADKAAKNTNTYDVQAVYGGGNLAAYEPVDALLDYSKDENKAKVEAARPEVYIDGCGLTSIKQVYGGGNAAPAPATYVEVNRAYEIDEVFGGGNGFDNYSLKEGNATVWYQNPGANVGYYTYASYPKGAGQGSGTQAEPYISVETSEFAGGAEHKEARLADNDAAAAIRYGSGIATLVVKGGTIHTSYGGSNSKGNVRAVLSSTYTASFDDCPMSVDQTYGGGKNAYSDADADVSADCAKGVTEMFGGSKDADFNGNINMLITNGSSLERVFGGNNTSGAVNGSITITLKEGGCEPIRIQNLYLGGFLAPYSVYGYAKNEDGSYKTEMVDYLDEDNHIQQKEQRIPLKKGEAGALAKPHQDPRINVISATYIGNIFGGGYQAKLVGNPHINVNMEPGKILKDYVENTTANPFVGEHKDANNNVIYVGKEIAENGDGILEIGSIGNIYGGGNLADIVGDTYVEIGTGTWVTSWDADGKAVYTDITPARNAATITGNVFGGGKGKADSFECAKAMVGSDGESEDENKRDGGTNVIIGNGTVKGNVYGGGEIGRVERNTSVTIGLGEGVEGGTKTPVIEGNVFGAGSGLKTHGYSALVRGNSTVTVQGNAWVQKSVYGGGEIATVGKYKVDATTGLPTEPDRGGLCTVTVQGWAEIGPDNMQMKKAGGPDDTGYVFGACKGVLPYQGYGDSEKPQHMDGKKVDGKWTDVPKEYKAFNELTLDNNVLEVDDAYMTFVNTLALASNTEVTIGGHAFVKGAIYGGSENGHVQQNTHVTIDGDCQIGNGDGVNRRYTSDEWAYDGSSDAKSLKECASWDYGKKTGTDANGKDIMEYLPYDVYKDSDNDGTPDYASDGHTFYGNVFGGGSGYFPYHRNNATALAALQTKDSGYADGLWHREAGSVGGNTVVDIKGGHILTSVYGGNECTDVTGTCTINMTGGTVGVPRTVDQIKAHPVTCYVFGAGKGDQRINFNTWTNVASTQVNISGKARIFGSTFGGGEDGHVLGDVKTTIDGTDVIIGTTGTSYVDGNIFGGGRGFSGDAQTAGTVGGNAEININAGTMLGSVYGGGRLASVGTLFTAPNDPNYGNFQEDADGKTYGHVTINISGGTIGNEVGNVESGNVFGGSMGRLDLLNGKRNPIWPKMAQVKATEVNISGGTIRRNVFGGGELGTVRDDASVTISGGAVRRDVFGGGYGSEDKNHTIFTVKELEEDNSYHDHTYAFTPMQFAGCVGKSTTVNVNDGYIRKSVYGGGEMASVGVINYRAEELTAGTNTDNKIVIRDSESGKDYFYSNMVKHAPVNENGKEVYYDFGLSWPYEFSYVPGFEGATHVNITGGRLGLKGSDKDDSLTDNGDVYGAGKGLAGDYKDYLFCANVGSTDVKIAYPSTPTAYDPEGDCIAGAAYGGGEDGHVMGDTKLTISGGLINHSVYGAGSGKGKFTATLKKIGLEETYEANIYSITAGKVFGNSTVEMSGGYVVRNVYGGGNMGSVGKGNYAGGADDYSTAGYGEKLSGNLWDGVSDFSKAFLNSGKCTVKITGGTIGYIASDPSSSMYPWNSSASLPYGNVFGGCRGESAPNITESPRYLYSPEFFVGYANETSVEIGKADGSGPTILGSVYGGGMDGHVRRDASVTIKGGEIGLPYTDANRTLLKTEDVNNIQWLARGNVYGAGSGIGKYKYDFDYDGKYISTVEYNGRQTKEEDFSTSAGSVTRFTTVNINGGKIFHNVYGGGSLSSVGAPKIPPTRTDELVRRDDSDAGKATLGKQSLNHVMINGGQIGDAASVGVGYGGNVFGASRGDANLENPESFATAIWTDVDVTDGTIEGDVYGGGEVGSVKQNTEVDLTGGTIKHDAYGGGKGTSEVAANVGGDATLTLDGTKFIPTYSNDENKTPLSGRVFGANNVNGTPKGHVKVHVLRTVDSAKDTKVALANRTTYDVAAVYGGGNNADYRPTSTSEYAEVIIEGCDQTSIRDVYGGGNAAATPANSVMINGCYIIDNVYGGGNGTVKAANVGYKEDGYTTLGTAKTNLSGGYIHNVYGGSNSQGNVLGGSSVTNDKYSGPGCCDVLQVEEIFGGGKKAEMFGGAEIVLGCMPNDWVGAIYAGAENANVGGDVSLTLTSGKFERVFGGNKSGGAIDGYIEVNIEENPNCETPIIIGGLYGGGNMAPYTVPAKYTANNPDYPSPRVNVRAFTSIGNIYGGGFGENATVTGNPLVNINQVEGGREYAGEEKNLEDGTTVTLYPRSKDGKMGVIGNVFGGGNAAKVIGNTTVNIGTESEQQMVSLQTTDAEGKVVVVKKPVVGADIRGNVYGGGNNAAVEGKTDVVIGKKKE